MAQRVFIEQGRRTEPLWHAREMDRKVVGIGSSHIMIIRVTCEQVVSCFYHSLKLGYSMLLLRLYLRCGHVAVKTIFQALLSRICN